MDVNHVVLILDTYGMYEYEDNQGAYGKIENNHSIEKCLRSLI